MNKCSLILFFGLISTCLFGQSSYYDALELKKKGKPILDGDTKKVVLKYTPENQTSLFSIIKGYDTKRTNKEVDSLLQQYNIQANLLKTIRAASKDSLDQRRKQTAVAIDRKLKASLSGNPFISLTGTVQSFDGSNLEEKISSGITSIGGFNAATIADGLAKFLVNRTKQELTMTFFEKFKEDLEKYPELKTLFPKTFDLLRVVGDEIYNFSGYLNMLREAFQLDLQSMIPNLRQLLDDSRLAEYLNSNQTIDFILRNALLIAEDLQNGTHPGDMLTSLKEENNRNTTIRNLSPGLELIDLFSQSLRSNEDDRYWVSSNDVRALAEDEIAFRIYLGLIYQKGKDIKFIKKNTTDTLNFGTVLTTINDNYNANVPPLKKYVKQLVSKAEKVDQTLKTIKTLNAAEDSKSSYADHYAFYISAVNLIDHVPSILDIPSIANAVYFDREKFDLFIDISIDIGNLYLDVREKNYFGAVMSLNAVLDKAVPGNQYRLDEKVEKMNAWIKKVESLKQNEVGALVVDIRNYAELQDQGALIETLLSDLKALESELNDANKDQLKTSLTQASAAYELLLSKLSKELMEKYREVISKLLKYGNLAASIAEAESSDEVEKIIESIALPAGSSRIKRESLRNVSLNAYMGLIGGGSKIPIEGQSSSDFKFTTGLSAPIGFAYSFGSLWNDEKNVGGKSITLFVPLIDIGALASFRFEDDSTEIASNIELKNIFAPGAFIYLGFGKVPVSLGVGGQYGPRLHDIVNGVTEQYKDYYVRWGVTLAVDIPLLNLYTKPD